MSKKPKRKAYVPTITDGKYHCIEVRSGGELVQVYVDGKVTKDPEILALVLGSRAPSTGGTTE